MSIDKFDHHHNLCVGIHETYIKKIMTTKNNHYNILRKTFYQAYYGDSLLFLSAHQDSKQCRFNKKKKGLIDENSVCAGEIDPKTKRYLPKCIFCSFILPKTASKDVVPK